MLNIINLKKICGVAILLSVAFSACNKLPEAVPTPPLAQGNAATTIFKKIGTTPGFGFFNLAVTRTGTNALLDDPNTNFTVYAPTDTAFKTLLNGLLGIPLGASNATFTAAINGLPLTTLAPIVRYHVLTNERIDPAQVSTTFPNVIKPTSLNVSLVTPPGAPPSLKLPINLNMFPSARGSAAWANNIPVAAANVITGSNGVVHAVPAVILPPSRVLLDTISRDPDFAYLVAAVVRADSGLATTSSSRLQNALAEPLANLTVFAPTNAAFQNLIFGLVYQQVFALTGNATIATAQANAAVAAGPAFLSTNNVTTTLVRGIVVYHVLGQRAYAPNFPGTAANFQTLLNSAIPTHPGVTVNANFTGPFATGLSVKGLANPTAATAAGVLPDRVAVNGVFYKINQVLLPQ
jgi:uncharacterized surface protein with fasciclin (FAS1) repeats